MEKELLAAEFARNLLSWKNSGFSIDNSVRLTDAKSKESLAEYIARPPLSLKKICYETFKGKVLFQNKYSEYFGENTRLFDALEFLAEAHVTKPSAASSGSSRSELHNTMPPRRVQLSRRYGLYSSRTKDRWSQMPHIAVRAPEGWRESHLSEASAAQDPGVEPLNDGEEVTVNARKRAWARLLAKVYEIDPLVCPKCGSEMKCSFATAKPRQFCVAELQLSAVIQNPMEIRHILAHLIETGRALPAFDPTLMN